MSKEGCGIYAIINRVNCKMYVGSSMCLHKRRVNHFNSLRRGDHRNRYLQSSWDKYGEKNFEWKILEFCKKEELLKREYHYIQYYNTTNDNCGYNLCLDPSRPSMSEETKIKLSKSRKGIKFSDEHLKNLSLSHKGIKQSKETIEKRRKKLMGRKGKPLSDEMKKRISEKLKGRKLPQEVVEKMKAKKWSEERKLEMSIRMKGKPIPKLKGRKVWNKGLTYKNKPLSEEAKNNMRKAVEARKERNGYILSEESIKKMKETIKNNPQTFDEERRRGISERAKAYWRNKKDKENEKI